MSAIDLYARAGKDFDARLAATRTALQQLVQDHPRASEAAAAPVVQASSLGAEDMVVSHLINSLELDAGIFVLQTGMLHAETLGFMHPQTEEDLMFQEDPPSDFLDAIARLRAQARREHNQAVAAAR